MAKIELLLDKADAHYTAGETISGKVILALDKQVKYRKITATFFGMEQTLVGSGKNSRDEINMLAEGSVVLKSEGDKKEGILNPGNYEFPFNFALPANSPPSYDGENVSIGYRIAAWVDVPLWFDIKAEKEISVTNAQAPPNASETFASDASNAQKPSFSVRLNNPVLQAGQDLKGAITVFNPSNSRVSQAILKIYALEHASAQGASANARIFEVECKIQDASNGVPREFSIKIPQDAHPSYASKLSGIAWAIEARLDIPMWFDVKAEKTVIVLPAPLNQQNGRQFE